MPTVFGPVNSRRFGTSLGIDLSPSFKQCNFDCLYCELAPAAPVTVQSDVVSVETVMHELQKALATHTHIDDITVTANGEPTLYPHLDELIERIDTVKGKTKTLILSNAAALNDDRVFATLQRFDRVKLSLDAVTPDIFKKIDRPAPGIEVASIIEAMQRFARCYDGELFIEILFVKGLNDTANEIEALNRVLLDIPCKRIDIGTIDRPPAYPVESVDFASLHAIASAFDPALPVHIAARTESAHIRESYDETEILNTLDKRPLTMHDMQTLFDDATLQRLDTLIEAGHIVASSASGVTFYLPAKNLHRKRRKPS